MAGCRFYRNEKATKNATRFDETAQGGEKSDPDVKAQSVGEVRYSG